MGDLFSGIGILLVFSGVAMDIFIKKSKIFIESEERDEDKETVLRKFKRKKSEYSLHKVNNDFSVS